MKWKKQHGFNQLTHEDGQSWANIYKTSESIVIVLKTSAKKKIWVKIVGSSRKYMFLVTAVMRRAEGHRRWNKTWLKLCATRTSRHRTTSSAWRHHTTLVPLTTYLDNTHSNSLLLARYGNWIWFSQLSQMHQQNTST